MARYEIRGPEHAAGYSIREQENKKATLLEAQNLIRLTVNQRTRDMAKYSIRGPENTRGPDIRPSIQIEDKKVRPAGYLIRGPEYTAG